MHTEKLYSSRIKTYRVKAVFALVSSYFEVKEVAKLPTVLYTQQINSYTAAKMSFTRATHRNGCVGKAQGKQSTAIYPLP